MPIVDNPGNYLGMPTLWGRSTYEGDTLATYEWL